MYESPWRKLQDRILVVTDDPSGRKTLKRLFEVEGFAVEIRSERHAGLASFYSNPPAATFLDLQLPKLSKQHLCEEMKAASPSIPGAYPKRLEQPSSKNPIAGEWCG
jgi:CheY-like chemotaxis protein